MSLVSLYSMQHSCREKKVPGPHKPSILNNRRGLSIRAPEVGSAARWSRARPSVALGPGAQPPLLLFGPTPPPPARGEKNSGAGAARTGRLGRQEPGSGSGRASPRPPPAAHLGSGAQRQRMLSPGLLTEPAGSVLRAVSGVRGVPAGQPPGCREGGGCRSSAGCVSRASCRSRM